VNREVRQLVARMSLREPQRQALEILADVLTNIELGKNPDLTQHLSRIRDRYPSVAAFEREFTSLCFALATGVGKTRLMGAFIAYLYETGRSRHFFVLAPNLTIYDKLKSDFDPASPKYVFKGIPSLALNSPVIITGENYETGIGVRDEGIAPMTTTPQLFGAATAVQINIFNISKINTEVRGGNAPRMKRLQEYIGQSYFEYLSGLDDLVLLMDEAHRYRASAGARAIAELRPILGLELTATPKTVGAGSQPFKNVIYHYGLGAALADGLVKEPAVATRKDFDASTVPGDELEQIKLEDGVRYHEYVKVELETFARQNGLPRVHPFMLVVAQDTEHARQLRARMEADAFFGGTYRGKVIEVHSAQKAEESDEATSRLLALEHDVQTEVVIHVNKLKEGWDVRNLFTIVPLRASASDILTEQTLGRGLRLPYGKRTGHKAIDRLTVIAHDRFSDIIAKAGLPDSVIREQVLIGAGGDVPDRAPRLVEVQPAGLSVLTGQSSRIGNDLVPNRAADAAGTGQPWSTHDHEIAREAMRALERRERLPSTSHLEHPIIQAQIIAEVTAIVRPPQADLLPGTSDTGIAERAAEVIAHVTRKVVELTIEYPNVVLIPTRQTSYGFHDFDLQHLNRISYPPVSEELIVQALRSMDRDMVGGWVGRQRETRPENYLIATLGERDEIDYDAHAELLNKLAGQVVSRLRVYLPDADAIENVLIYYRRQLSEFVWAQMQSHLWETPTDYQPRITQGFTLLRPIHFSLADGQEPRDYRSGVLPGESIRSLVFTGFGKCCYDLQRFDSVSGELTLARTLEADPDVLRWMKPASQQFRIEWANGKNYEPDFVVETRTEKLLLETKARDALSETEVVAKANAASQWCVHATAHAQQHQGKPWRYALIPDDGMIGAATAKGLADRFGVATAAH